MFLPQSELNTTTASTTTASPSTAKPDLAAATPAKPLLMFDMDGTLLDLAFDDWFWNSCLNQAHAAAHQLSLEASREQLYQYYLQHQHSLAWYSSNYWSKTIGVDVLALQQQHQQRIQARTGCFELLEQLKAQGYRCWLVTNADCATLALKLQNVDLSPYFEVIVSSESLGAAKEDQGFWQALQALHPFDAGHSVMIDDTAKVLASAQQYGIGHLLMIAQPSSQSPAKMAAEMPFQAIHDLSDIMTYLQQVDVQNTDLDPKDTDLDASASQQGFIAHVKKCLKQMLQA